MPTRLSDAAPREKAIGTEPRIVASDVMRIGRKRSAAASLAASCQELPSSRRWLATSTMRMPFFVTKPMSTIEPICEKMLSVSPLTHNDSTAPASASGTVNIIVSGSIQLSNCAARIRYTSIRARMNAKSKLEELSRKSRDGPVSAVEYRSSSCCFVIDSIAVMPSAIVLPGARPALIVALTARLYR